MPKIIFTGSDGAETTVEARTGDTLMEVAVDNSIAGMVAECGGACACATCHAYVDPAWLEKLGAMDEMESAMLDAAADRRDNSRLACQIEISDEIDGLKVTVADNES